jgi:hypothetical protein
MGYVVHYGISSGLDLTTYLNPILPVEIPFPKFVSLMPMGFTLRSNPWLPSFFPFGEETKNPLASEIRISHYHL